MSFSVGDVLSRSSCPKNQSAAAVDDRATTQLANSSSGVRLGDVMASPICRCGGSIGGAAVGPNAWQKTMSRAPGLSSKQHACGYFREGSQANFCAGPQKRANAVNSFGRGVLPAPTCG